MTLAEFVAMLNDPATPVEVVAEAHAPDAALERGPEPLDDIGERRSGRRRALLVDVALAPHPPARPLVAGVLDVELERLSAVGIGEGLGLLLDPGGRTTAAKHPTDLVRDAAISTLAGA